jgi:hypothetical protein
VNVGSILLYAAGPVLGLTVLAVMAAGNEPESRQYTFAWPFAESGEMRPRGGTTEGPEVTLDREPGEAWRSLREPDLPGLERDRRAILAMAGPYRTSFDFIETVGFVPGFSPSRPYQSWATEYVHVIADEPGFISLQHVLVMFFGTDDGEVHGPMVTKHWRQDWRYEDRDLHVYVGADTWERRRLSQAEVRGTWSQAVYQVDDSPRYEAIGRWEHRGNHSSWVSGDSWRPLPRREFSVRDDYDVLAGTNRHTITPTGWVHEEDNLKLVLDEAGRPRDELPYLAREAGLNRYERIVGHDFSAGDAYWERTGDFWGDVREAWREIKADNDRFTIRPTVDGKRLLEAMFEYADGIESAASYDPAQGRAWIRDTLARFVE